MARPKKVIDYIAVEKLAMMHATQEEIASFLNINVRTLQRDDEFCRIYKKGIDNGKISLRRLQWKSAEAGDKSMLIWLGKQYLGQKEDASINLNSDRVVIVNDLPNDKDD